jgi:hypothetical protein
MTFERDIADRFWYFVRFRAIDKRTEKRTRYGSNTLDRLEVERSEMLRELAEEADRFNVPWLIEDDFVPWTYPTLQEALQAFLIDEAARDRFPYPYELWLCAVPVIVTDVNRDSERLHVIACDWDPNFTDDDKRDLPYKQWDHTMTISDDWSCLSREVFEFIMSHFTGKG